ncbi:MAG: DUF6538 domain-containing protein [Methylobacter sp.]
MAKVPYLIRRNNIYYLRFIVPVEFQNRIKSREIVQSLKTEETAKAIPLALRLASCLFEALYELEKSAPDGYVDHMDILRHANELFTGDRLMFAGGKGVLPLVRSNSITLSQVVADFFRQYDASNKAMLLKLTATLPILVELLDDKTIDQILQSDINRFFEDIQKLPVRRDCRQFSGLSFRQIIDANAGPCIAEKTFNGTYRACASIFIEWAKVNYKDQGFPDLSVKGAIYRGNRSGGINKQRAMKPEELQLLFVNHKMKTYAASVKTAHYCWLPLIGLYTGARINEICQLNPAHDIRHDADTGIYYFHFTDAGETAKGVSKSIKTHSSKRIVPIHSKLIELGFLTYVARIRAHQHKIIFPEWKPRNGKASVNAGKWFIRYLDSLALSDDAEGARLSGFHAFRHTFITYGIKNKISGIFAITGHETASVDGFDKMSAVAKGYWTRNLTEDIEDRKIIVERFIYDIGFYRPK